MSDKLWIGSLQKVSSHPTGKQFCQGVELSRAGEHFFRTTDGGRQTSQSDIHTVLPINPVVNPQAQVE